MELESGYEDQPEVVRKNFLKKSCDSCAAKKLKCDGKFPICSRCASSKKTKRSRKSNCSYSMKAKSRNRSKPNISERIDQTCNIGRDCFSEANSETSLLERKCIMALYEMQSAKRISIGSDMNFPFTTSNNQSLTHESQKEFTPTLTEDRLGEGKLNSLLSSFKSKTTSLHSAFVHFPLIQRALWPENDNTFLDSYGTLPLQQNDPACWTYFLAALGLGALQSENFQPEMQIINYQAMETSFKTCCGDERMEVIWAHLLVALFCFVTFQKISFEKHSNLANILVNCATCNISFEAKQAHVMLLFFAQLPLLSCSAIEMEMLGLFYQNFAICPEELNSRFPHIACYFSSLIQETSMKSVKSDWKLTGFFELFQTNPTILVPLLTSRFLQKTMSLCSVSIQNSVEVLSELQDFNEHVLKLTGFSIDAAPSMVRGYLLLIESFKCIVCYSFDLAKALLVEALGLMDFWTLRTGYFMFGELMVHQLHFVIAAAITLQTEREYNLIWRKLDSLFILMERPLMLPSSLSAINCKQCYSLCACNKKSENCHIPLQLMQNLNGSNDSKRN